ncbi:hypothetical protein [Rhodophyticola porphyridii]|uniref:Uncharacterized protein n=1 Tax=Rhodophyticola porphyridii TaxID=1852017 RepID=A0A3L9YGF1_9RHOB|nr:hypothetical protein [Rhodophyticola porphyridii]RMA41910.1 hypothetical protein D9R08_10515 [Rhodophyticola porphyridii]
MRSEPNPSNRFAGAAAAATDGITSLSMLLIGMLWIGASAMQDPAIMARRAMEVPSAFWIQDGLKLVSAAASIVLIVAIRKLTHHAGWIRWPGFLAAACLIGNAALSIALMIGLASPSLVPFIGLLAFGAALSGALWLVLLNGTALVARPWPPVISILGIGAGLVGFYPPLGMVAFALGLTWTCAMIWVFLHKA